MRAKGGSKKRWPQQSVASAQRQHMYYVIITPLCCHCAITSSRETDEQNERGRVRERRSGAVERSCRAMRSRGCARYILCRKPFGSDARACSFSLQGGGAAQFLAMAAPHADRRRYTSRRLGLHETGVRMRLQRGKSYHSSDSLDNQLMFKSPVDNQLL